MQRRYDREIIVQRRSVTQSGSGEEIETWVDLCYKVLAFKPNEAIKGGEGFSNPERVANQMVTFVIRFHEIPAAYRPLLPQDRIIYPVDGIGANAQTPPWNRVYDIVSPDEVNREVDLSIKTIRRADVTT